MKVLVTGARGFIGQSLCRALSSLDLDIIKTSRTNRKGFLQLDLHDMDDARSTLKEINPDVVINLSWNTSGSDYLVSSDNYVSLEWNRKLFQICAEISVRKVISLGSAAESRSRTKDPEETLSTSLYADSKRKASQAFFETFTNSSIEHHWLQVFQVYGKGQSRQRFLPSVLESYKQQSCFVLKNPYSIRDWIHVDDVATSIIVTLKSQLPSEFEVGTAVGTSNIEICQFLRDSYGLRFEYEDLCGHREEDILVASSSSPLLSVFKPEADVFNYLVGELK